MQHQRPTATRQRSMLSLLTPHSLLITALLAGCAGSPPPADWKMNAVSLLEHAETRWLEGDSAASTLALAKVRGEIARSGRLDLLARAELAACAARVASLDFAECKGYTALAADATPEDAAYARFLAGDWNGLDAKRLPAHYAGLVSAKDEAAANRAVAEIAQPLPRLIAAALLFKQGRSQPATLALAVDTASQQGWRRPLLAWLEIETRRARAAGDTETAARLQRRMEFTLGNSRK